MQDISNIHTSTHTHTHTLVHVSKFTNFVSPQIQNRYIFMLISDIQIFNTNYKQVSLL